MPAQDQSADRERDRAGETDAIDEQPGEWRDRRIGRSRTRCDAGRTAHGEAEFCSAAAGASAARVARSR